MARELATGLTIRRSTLECTILRRGRRRHTVVDSRTADIKVEDGVEVSLPLATDSDVAAISAKIRAACGKIEGPVSVALSPRHVLMRVVELPTVDEDEVAGMVQLQVDKFSPFPTDATIVSHEVISKTENASCVLIAIVERKTVDSVGAVLTAARIFPQRVDIETLCWLQLLRDAKELSQQGCQVTVLQDVSCCEIIITQDGLPVAFRSLGETGDIPDEDIYSEIEYSLTTLEVEHGIAEAQGLSLWHWGAKPRELMHILEEKLPFEVRCKSFESLPSLSEGLARRFLDDKPKGVNLRLPEWHAEQSNLRLRKNLVVASVAALAIWLAAVLALFGAIQFGKRKLADLETIRSEIEEPANRAREIRSMLRMLQSAEQSTNRPCSALDCLDTIARAVPHDPSGGMKGINEIKLFHYDSVKRKQVEIRGEASDPNYVYDFEKSLNNSGMFSKVELKGPRRLPRGNHWFSILLDLPMKDDG